MRNIKQKTQGLHTQGAHTDIIYIWTHYNPHKGGMHPDGCVSGEGDGALVLLT
jgi:hypothetical protein